MFVVDRVSQTQFSSWMKLRNDLEQVDDPLETVTRYFLKLPRTKFYTDPYDESRWPTPWELIEENEYCQFNILLGICYTLQLTERFKDCQATINVALDKINKTVYYLLFINDKVYGYLEEDWMLSAQLPKSLRLQKIYAMKPLH
jgi:hypothetical protein